MKSKIAIEGMEFYAYHGFYEEEQKIGGKYIVDVYFKYDSGEAWKSDLLSETINYEKTYAIVKIEMEIASKLIETVCRRIFDKVKEEVHNTMESPIYVLVRVSKCNPPIKGKVSNVYVELEG